jgi:uncharacterized protein (TIGR02246 family)
MEDCFKMRLKACLIFLIACSCARGGAQPAASAEDAVRSVWAQETDAWTRHDAKAIVSLYTSDAIWQNPFGVRIHGSANLEKFLNRLFQLPGYLAGKDTDAAKITDLRFPAPTVAVVWSEESSEGQVDDSTGKPMHPRHSYYLEVLIKTDAGWKISECLIMDEI